MRLALLAAEPFLLLPDTPGSPQRGGVKRSLGAREARRQIASYDNTDFSPILTPRTAADRMS